MDETGRTGQDQGPVPQDDPGAAPQVPSSAGALPGWLQPAEATAASEAVSLPSFLRTSALAQQAGTPPGDPGPAPAEAGPDAVSDAVAPGAAPEAVTDNRPLAAAKVAPGDGSPAPAEAAPPPVVTPPVVTPPVVTPPVLTQPIATAPVPAAPAAPRRRRWGLRAGLALVLLPVAFALVAAIGLIGQEVTAPTWLKTRIEAQAATALGGGSLRFGEVTVTIARDLHPRVRLRDAVLRDAAGAVLARVPMIEALLSPRGLILWREVLPQEITLTGAELALQRNADGSVAVAFAGAPRAVGQAAGLANLLQEVEAVFDRGPLAAMEQLRIEGLILNYVDARAGRSWTVDGGQVTLDLRGGMARLRGELALLSGRAFVTTMQVSYDSPRDSPAAEMAVTVIDAAAADIATQSPALAWLSVLNAPLSTTLRASVDAAGAFGQFRASLKLGQGAVEPVTGAAPVRFQGARADLTYDPAAGQIAFERISVQSDWGSLAATGQAWLTEMRGNWPGAIIGQLNFTELRIDPPGFYAEPLSLGAASLDLRLRLAPFRLTVGQFALTDPPPAAPDAPVLVGLAPWLSGRAEIAAAPEGWSIALDSRLAELRVDQIPGWWPESVRPALRQWFIENLTAGRFTDLRLGLRIGPGAAPALGATWSFDGITVRPMLRLPPITDAQGFGSFHNGQMAQTFLQGSVAPPQGGSIDLAGTSVVIPDLRIPRTPATVHLSAESSITAALSLLDMPPLSLLSAAGIPVTVADGRAKTRALIDLLLVDQMAPGELDYTVTARLSDVRTDWVVPGRVLAGSALDVAVTPTRMQIGGAMRLGVVPLSGTWSRDLGPGTQGSARAEGTVELSERFIDEFRIGLPPGSVSGAGQAAFTLDLGQPGAVGFRLSSDLDGVGLRMPPLGWSKAPGEGGSLTVEGRLGQAPRIDRLVLNAAGLRAEGAVTLTDDGGLDRAQFDRVRLDDWLDADITLRGRGAGQVPAVVIEGGTIDFSRANLGDSGGQGGPMSVTLDRLQVTDGIALTDFRGEFDASGGFTGDFTAGVNGAASLAGAVVPLNGRSAVRLRSDEAGAVLRAAGFLQNAQGGALDLTLLPAGAEGNYDGVLAIDGLQVRDAPALASLLNAASVVGLLQQMAGQGLMFDRVDAEFRIDPDRITVLRSSAVGVGLGLSMDGVYTTATREMDFQGVISPFYLINGLGAVLTRRGEGLIGFNYTLRGPVGEPRVGVNPLSILTPGMFRELFRRPPPEVGE